MIFAHARVFAQHCSLLGGGRLPIETLAMRLNGVGAIDLGLALEIAASIGVLLPPLCDSSIYLALLNTPNTTELCRFLENFFRLLEQRQTEDDMFIYYITFSPNARRRHTFNGAGAIHYLLPFQLFSN